MDMNDLEHIGESVEAEPQAAVNRDEEAEDIRHYEAKEELIIGMEFNSIDEAFSQYKTFAFRCGFGIMRSGRRFTPDGDLKTVIFAYSKEEKLRKKKDESSTMTSVSQTRKFQDELRQLIQLNHTCIGDKNDCKTYEVIEIVKTNHGENKRLRFDVLYKGATEEELKAKTANHISTLIDASLPYQPNSTAQSTNRASNIINNEKVFDPIVAQAKGRPKSKRKVSRCEIAVNKIKNTKKQHESSIPSSTPPSQPRSSQIREQSHQLDQLDEEFETWMASQL
ncbi:hypothetical protein QJS10_CPB17g00993 [Acorus calamus]|uniref:Protein FAR1-RELATED SEQUENCE n=1 Tax=Acorus calamus TaxID=4465 RepID=A0AAV9CW08_ACOCL|nr:hypothetical protein QJS10_CPB17g00993 [Acorus calamus]